MLGTLTFFVLHSTILIFGYVLEFFENDTKVYFAYLLFLFTGQ